MRKSWTEKLHNARAPEVVTLRRASGGAPAGSRMLIPTPLQVRDYIETIPWGATVPVPVLRSDLAREAEADATCPLCTGMFLRIVAEAALEDKSRPMTPFWRVIDPDSATAAKLTCGRDFIRERRQAEAVAAPEITRRSQRMQPYSRSA
jgi:hypothetical protein